MFRKPSQAFSGLRKPKRHRLTAALLAAATLPLAAIAVAQSNDESAAKKSATDLDRVTVTGSLIPRSEIETATPVIVVTQEEIRSRGFTSIADVLRSSTFGSGGSQGGQTANTFTQGAEAVSFFGLPPGYTKYLINGRPMQNYPALYNGADVFNNISGIPIDAVERVEIIPGGASSLYGSDALAGVVNFIMVSNYEGTTVNVRAGGYSDGGGSSTRFSLTNGLNALDNRLNMINSIQYEKKDPIWRYQRDEMKHYNFDGYDPQNIAASRDIVLLPSLGGTRYPWPDGVSCPEGLFGGTQGYQTRPRYTGAYCGTMYSGGYTTISNEKESTQYFNRTTFELNDRASLYGELLYNRETSKYFAGSNVFWYGSDDYYDPDFGQLLYMQRAFAPEEVGSFKDIMSRNKTESYTATLGIEGSFGESWDYNASFTRNEYELDEVGFSRYADPLAAYWEQNIFGPVLGTYAHPIYGNFPIYRPDYGNYFSALTPAQMAQFTGYETDRSKTWDNLFRTILTNADLFGLPGGSAGLAFGVEAGSEGWDYSPSAAKLNGELWGTSAIAGAGHRSKYAGYSELRLPFWDQLTVTLSGRYDAFEASEIDTLDKFTWSAGLEYRPIKSLLLRGKYGTAFRAPTLSDLFQGRSTAYSYVPDFYRCSLPANGGHTPDDISGCAYNSEQIITARAGNTGLESTSADTWNAGFVWAPMDTFSFSADYYSWKIEDEPRQISARDILEQEYYCSVGQPGRAIASCSDVSSWIARGPGDRLEEVFTPRINIAQQRLNLLLLQTNYLQDIGRWGSLKFNGSYSNKLKHELQNFPDLPVVDRLDSPAQMYVDGAKWSAEGSLGWNVGDWTTTWFTLLRGSTPNWVAQATNSWNAVNAFGAEAGRFGTYVTHNLGIDYRAAEGLRVSLQVNNLFNKYPFYPSAYPTSTNTPYNTYLNNAYGRSVYLQTRIEF
ncbi:TonB-dependent receptor [Pseudoxanthomonas spadix BD-a59]|uniref:TonB-dependent receptor n=1 Tax=Pseudoxanthomonas spadix (strain BD-a59) TaxID=1045855 RepID=G7USG6_PSEUP|nr:TonB-dependent receptor [Pseudoxanthomonas spadix]AER56038.1 TonB-dependent receptor [Pseudoxanthomonas spadix BD-a59]